MAGSASAQRPERTKRRRGVFVYYAAVAAIGLVAGVVWHRTGTEHVESEPRSIATVAAARYIGSDACASCHHREADEWRTSQHRDAMADATDESVLGRFDGSPFSYAGTTSTFSKRDDAFYLRTDGRDGQLAEFRVKYTFGLYPLQQYLVEFPDGRLQVPSIAWDARPRSEGGQRWFHLYPQERITHDDELHWTRPAQNWNFMCADCHSTGVRKNYDRAADRFETRWSEISVGCEACHGPGSRHVEWAGMLGSGQPALRDEAKGLNVQLQGRQGSTWSINPASGNAFRSHPRATEREIEVCAQCHARRGQIAEGYEAGKPFLDHYRPALLSTPLYHADGQQRDEVYNWGSFLQSKMYAQGVTCSDCHNPHTGKVRAENNTLCATCHLPKKYDTASHHNHMPGSAGAACVGCHMPTTSYMVVDPRHDHSLRVPRPDLSVTLGTPNACTGCHTNRTASWAASQVKSWYGHEPQGFQRFAAAFTAAAGTAPGRQDQLGAIADDGTQPPIARATALASLDASASRATLEAAARSLRDPDALVRLGALQSLASIPPNVRLPLVAPLLSDPLRALRIEAASLVASVPVDQLRANERAAFERAAGEFVDTQLYNADRPEARVNLGTFYGSRGNVVKAEDEFKAAIRLEPSFLPAYVNLADLLRVLGRDADGERVVRQALEIAPRNGMLHHALGLALVRLSRTGEALGELERASVLEPGNVRFAYVYAVALHSGGRVDAAIETLEKALTAHPDDINVRTALASFKQSRGPTVPARAPVR
ncbi:MAG: tetratricopeptide repeat protein [Vicinamibacterales bacterium]